MCFGKKYWSLPIRTSKKKSFDLRSVKEAQSENRVRLGASGGRTPENHRRRGGHVRAISDHLLLSATAGHGPSGERFSQAGLRGSLSSLVSGGVRSEALCCQRSSSPIVTLGKGM